MIVKLQIQVNIRGTANEIEIVKARFASLSLMEEITSMNIIEREIQ